MPRTSRLAVLLGVFVVAALAFPSVADAQRRGGGGGGGSARGGGAVVRGGGGVARGGGVYRGNNVAVPRTHPPYSYYRPYYSRSYYRPYYSGYYSGYYPRYYSPWSFSLSFGFGYGYGAYAPFYGYPYYASPYVAAYPSYSYPYAYPPAYPYASPNAAQPQYPPPTSDNGYNTSLSYSTDQARTTVPGDDRGEFGTLSMRVMPADATILIDQQAWDRPRGDDRFSIELAGGSHHVEIRKAGYTTYARTIDVPRGRSVIVNVALTPGGTGTMQVARTVPLRR